MNVDPKLIMSLQQNFSSALKGTETPKESRQVTTEVTGSFICMDEMTIMSKHLREQEKEKPNLVQKGILYFSCLTQGLKAGKHAVTSSRALINEEIRVVNEAPAEATKQQATATA